MSPHQDLKNRLREAFDRGELGNFTARHPNELAQDGQARELADRLLGIETQLGQMASPPVSIPEMPLPRPHTGTAPYLRMAAACLLLAMAAWLFYPTASPLPRPAGAGEVQVLEARIASEPARLFIISGQTESDLTVVWFQDGEAHAKP